jgi:excisionase family DNA binding protein
MIYTATAAAKQKGVARSTVSRALADGSLRSEWHGTARLILAEDLDRWVPRKRGKPVTPPASARRSG